VLHHPAFVAGDFDTSFVDTVFADADRARERRLDVAVAAAALSAFRERQAARLQPPVGGDGAWWRSGLAEGHRTRL
jgi:hypothetical protein